MITIKNILVPTDFSEPAVAALNYGRTLAAQFSATLHIVHVVDDLTLKAITAEGFVSYMPDLQRELEEAARKRLDALIAGEAAGAAGIVPAIITSNSAADAIVTYAKDARGRRHRHRHTWPQRRVAAVARQRRRARRAHRAVPGIDRSCDRGGD